MMMRVIFFILFLGLKTTLIAQIEICQDQIDNDFDLLTDCADPDCSCPTAFPCQDNSQLYQYLNGSLSEWDGQTWTPISNWSNNGIDINAIGYNVQDGFIYGIDRNNGHLITISNQGITSSASVGLQGLPNSNWHTGDMDLSGNLYVSSSINNDMYIINVNTLTSTYVVFTGLPTTPLGVADWTYLPATDKLYGIISNTNILRVMNLDGSHDDDIVLPNYDCFELTGAMFSDASGKMFASCNNGNFYKLSPNGDFTNFTATQITNSGIIATGNDGASCPLSLGVFDGTVIDSLILTACPGEQVEHNGIFYDEGSINEIIFTNSNGYDSILVLTVEAFELSNDLLTFEACEGSSYNYNGTEIPAGTQQSFIFSDINGCDSTLTVAVDIIPLESENLTLMACPGEQAMYNGTFYDIGTTNEIIFTGNNGCDSSINLSVEAFLLNNETLSVMACDGGFYNYNGTDIAAGTEENFLFTDSNGCDSIVTLIVEATSIIEIDSFVQACAGEGYIFEGVEVPSGTNEQFSFSINDSCDVLINLFVEPLPLDTTSLVISNCSDTTFSFMGQSIAIGEDASFNLQNQFGCDSLLTISVVENTQSSFLDIVICDGAIYEYNGEIFPIGTDTSFIFIDQQGCDSIVNLSISQSPLLTFSLQTEPTCWNNNEGLIYPTNIQGGISPFNYSIDGENYFTQDSFQSLSSGLYTIFIQDANQCIYTQEIEIEEIPEIEIENAPFLFPCDEDSILIEVDLVSGDITDLDWLWSTGDTTFFSFAQTAGNYNLFLSNKCQALEVDILVELEAEIRDNFIFVPNVFTPNDDGYNDQLKLFPAKDIEIIDFEIQIFNRWGALLFRTKDINQSWDGVFKNKNLNNGVYAYWMRATINSCQRNIDLFKEGDITIVR